MFAVFKRELAAYFQSPLGYVFMGFFILLSGIFCAITNFIGGNPNFTGVLSSITFIFLIVVPVLTMRLLSEEARQKTDQLLITSPLSITGMVLGKYLAAVAVFLITLAVTVIYPVIMSFFALGGLAGWEIFGGYFGFLLLGSSFIAVGLFMSSLTDNQFIAAVITFGALLLLWILDWVTSSIPTDAVSGLVFLSACGAGLVLLVYLTTKNLFAAAGAGIAAAAALLLGWLFQRAFFEGIIVRILQWFSLLKRYGEFSMGVLSLSPIVYYLSFCAAFVFLTVRMIEKRRWI